MIGSSTEGHVSHIFSARLSSRPKGWSKEGVDKVAQLRIYWINGGDILEIVHRKKEERKEETYFSASEIITWERKHMKANGKYIEALQARISNQISAKIFFNTSIAGL